MDTDNSHPSQAEGEDPDRPTEGSDPATGRPSQAEGDDTEADSDSDDEQ